MTVCMLATCQAACRFEKRQWRCKISKVIMLAGGRRIGVEFKREDAPRMTHSMQVAMADLKLDRLNVIYPGARRYRLGEKVEVLPLRDAIDAERMWGSDRWQEAE